MEFVAYVTPLCAQPRASSGQVCVGVMLLILLQRCKRSVVSLGCYLLASVWQSCWGPLGSVQWRQSMGWRTSPSPGWGDALGHRSVRGIFHELIGEIVAAFCGVVLGLAGSKMTWQNSQEMGRNRGAKGSRAIKSSQKEQNVCCAKNTQPRRWCYTAWQWHWAVSRRWMGRGKETCLEKYGGQRCAEGPGRRADMVSVCKVGSSGQRGGRQPCVPGVGFQQCRADAVSPRKCGGGWRTGGAGRRTPSRVGGTPGPARPRACGFGTEARCAQGRCFVFERLFAGPEGWGGKMPCGYSPPGLRFLHCYKSFARQQSFRLSTTCDLCFNSSAFLCCTNRRRNTFLCAA